MADKNRIDVLKEQISFIEARIIRYEDLLKGPTFQRILFGGGRQAKLSLLGLLAGIVAFFYSFARRSNGWLFVGMLFLAVLLLVYSVTLLNVIRKRNGKEKYQRMIDSLSREEASMNRELKKLVEKENR